METGDNGRVKKEIKITVEDRGVVVDFPDDLMRLEYTWKFITEMALRDRELHKAGQLAGKRGVTLEKVEKGGSRLIVPPGVGKVSKV